MAAPKTWCERAPKKKLHELFLELCQVFLAPQTSMEAPVNAQHKHLCTPITVPFYYPLTQELAYMCKNACKALKKKAMHIHAHKNAFHERLIGINGG